MPSMITPGGAALGLTLALLLVLLLVPATAQAKQVAGSVARTPDSASQARGGAAPERATRMSRRKPRILHLPSPAQESPAQRDRRLARECRGLPNAGACLGHALAAPRAGPPRR